MLFARVRPVPVADVVRAGERDREDVGLRPPAEIERAQAGQRGVEGELVHPRRVRKLTAGADGVARQSVRKRDVPAVVLLHHGIGLGIRGRRQQRRPLASRHSLRDAPRVHLADPGGQRVGVVAAGGELSSGRCIPEYLLLRATHGKDGAAILARDRKRARARVRRAQPVDQYGAAKAIGRRRRVARGQQRRLWIVHAGRVAHDAGGPRKPAGQHDRVAGRGLGDRVILEAVREDRTVSREAGEATRELGRPAVHVVAPHLVHRQEDNERGLVRPRARLRGQSGKGQQHRGGDRSSPLREGPAG